VDGQDVEAVLAAANSAVERARSGGGPTLLEMKTYRFSGHSRSDPATYRPAGELAEWQQRDPLLVARAALTTSGAATDAQLDAAQDQARERVGAAVKTVLASPGPALDEILAHVVS
jgi:pyruvate dehydrogenase E1 component alpha subunit